MSEYNAMRAGALRSPRKEDNTSFEINYNKTDISKYKSSHQLLTDESQGLILVLRKMLKSDADKAHLRNFKGLNAFDSKAIHFRFDGRKHITNNAPLWVSPILQSYPAQLKENGVTVEELTPEYFRGA